MTFFVLSPVEIKIIRWFGSPVRENPTYNCPCEKHSERRSAPTYLNVWPWALLIVIAKETLTGNWSRLNENGKSVGIMGILGINAISPVAG